ncbi:MAG: DUF4397 domain-containing protein [Pseudomonadota bacterium]|jgi:hypothetical protein
MISSFDLARYFLALVVSAVVIGCGGGGGGGGGNGGDGGGALDGADSEYGVRVLHAAIDASPVDLVVSGSGQTVVSQAVFAGQKSYRSAPSGAQNFNLTRAFAPAQVVASLPITVEGDGRYTVLLFGDTQVFGLRAKVVTDQIPDDFSGAVVRVVNGATGAAAVRVNVGAVSIPGATPFGGVSDYVEVPAGSGVSVVASRAADGQRAGGVTVDLAQGGAYTFLVAGEVGYYSKGVWFRDR